MEIAVLGTGSVGRAIAGRASELGHAVVIGTRDPQATRERTQPDAMGTPPFADWATSHPEVALHDFATAAAFGELIVNATNGVASLAALESAGAANLAGKVVLDIANPLDFSGGMPPTLFVKDTDSLAEQLQRAFPEARVVKALNTLNNALMVHPETLPEPTSVFVSGDDGAAKAVVVGLLEQFGHTDIIDLGDLSTARGTEMMMPVWLRLMGALRTPMFNYRIVR